jgi:hypothetical protein
VEEATLSLQLKEAKLFLGEREDMGLLGHLTLLQISIDLRK